MEMLRAVLIVLVICIVNTTFAQYRLQESLSPLTIQRQGYSGPATISSLDFLATPQTQIPRPRYGLKKTPKKASKISKRQYLAEVFKQSAINNMVAAASACTKGPVGGNLPLSNQLTNVARDLSKWRL